MWLEVDIRVLSTVNTLRTKQAGKAVLAVFEDKMGSFERSVLTRRRAPQRKVSQGDARVSESNENTTNLDL